jgi:hypothetical protein
MKIKWLGLGAAKAAWGGNSAEFAGFASTAREG